MPRITSQKTRQMLLVTGDPLNPLELPERVQLFDATGQPVDVTQDPSKMRWAGEWAVDVPYVWNDVVMDTGRLYILTNAAGLPADEPRPTESESGDWFLLTVAPPSPPPAFQGLWSSLTEYLAGSIVTHNDTGWATTADVAGLEPGAPTGTDWGGPVLGIQVKSTDKITQGMVKIVDFAAAELNTDGKLSLPVAIDFPSSTLADSHLIAISHADKILQPRFSTPNGSYQTLIEPGFINPGQTVDLFVRHATFYGYGDSTVFFDGPADTIGTVELTITNPQPLVPPDTSNPWLPL